MRKRTTSRAKETIKEATTKATEAVKETVEKTTVKASAVIEEAKERCSRYCEGSGCRRSKRNCKEGSERSG